MSVIVCVWVCVFVWVFRREREIKRGGERERGGMNIVCVCWWVRRGGSTHVFCVCRCVFNDIGHI